ncbi:MAG: beta-ketoacyl synthase N-terminal-like domain-containing protein [Bacteroidota bacterium]
MNINSSLSETPIAVIGLSALFADARNVEEFWTNIIQAKDSITDVPANRWKIEDYYDPDPSVPDKTYCKRGGFIPDIDFNPLEFGLPPNILEVTDASQLLALLAARDALEDAGYGRKSEKFTTELKAKTGCVLGVGGGQKLITPLTSRLQYPIWEKALRASGIAEDDIPPIIDKMKKAYIGWNENSFPGMLGNVISGRITNRFDLGGLNSVVDAACAASLSAIKMALSELVEGRCDMMLTGGVDTDNSPFMYMSFSKTPAFSKSGNIRPFDAQADGMLIGEGVGMIVLKRLEDAERDGDRIYAVVKGLGTSSDGRFKSVYAPRSSGQAMAMNRAYEDAHYDPYTVGLIEAHGTGTGAGDPTEFQSMHTVFGENNPRKQHIALGSVKSQIGHTKAAAGAAGMIKTVLALHHKVFPPTINVSEPNPKFAIEETPIYINTESRPWIKTNDHPRRASVSAFGFGGINVHIALEEYKSESQAAYRIHQPYKTVLMHAASANELVALCQQAVTLLQGNEAEAIFQKLWQGSAQAIPPAHARIGFVATSSGEAAQLLQLALANPTNSILSQASWHHPKGVWFRPQGMDAQGKTVALFSGQGSQYVGMGAALANAFPPVRAAFATADQQFNNEDASALSTKVFPIPVFSDEERKVQQAELTQTQYAQPAIGALSMGMFKVLQQAGFIPDFAAGHSFGELTALWAAGAYDDETFLALAQARGEAMASESDAGTMIAVKAGLAAVEPIVKGMEGVVIANINSTSQVVLGGGKVELAKATEALKAQGLTVIPLPVSAAFHTQYVAHAQAPFGAFVQAQKIRSTQIPVYANGTGQPYPKTPVAIKKRLGEQILNPVLFRDQIDNIHAAGGRVFVEFGPKGVLTNLVKDILKGKDFIAIAINANAKRDSDLQFRQAVVQMRVAGLDLTQVDPYQAPVAPLAEPAKLSVKLAGHNYVSPPTQKAYIDALNDGQHIKGGGVQIVEKIIEKPVIKEVEKIIEVPVASTSVDQNTAEDMLNRELLTLFSNTLDHFKTQQGKSLEVFQQFLADQQKQSQQLLDMMHQMATAEASPTAPVPAPVLSTPAAPIAAAPAIVSNGNGNGHQQPIAAATIVAPAPAAVTPAAPASGLSTGQLSNILLTVVSEKTGYPAEMLDLSMDMEADLGIDSIKRVEIFGAMTEQYPEVSGINPQELTELRTLGQIVDYIGQKAGATASPAPAAPLVAVTTTPAAPATATGLSNDQLSNILLTVVSEKTGYPAEMLDLSMDMEADLGIDSIKRVEIFGAMTEQYPEVSGINPQELTELRTLGQIVDYIGQKAGATASPSAPAAAAPTIAVVESAPATTAPASGTGLSNEQLSNILLTVVSEKTGYPAEMLDLGMDMEADLGIDSIKRVEIFGAMTEQYPEVSGINPQELTELRTLGQIVDYIAAKAGK